MEGGDAVGGRRRCRRWRRETPRGREVPKMEKKYSCNCVCDERRGRWDDAGEVPTSPEERSKLSGGGEEQTEGGRRGKLV